MISHSVALRNICGEAEQPFAARHVTVAQRPGSVKARCGSAVLTKNAPVLIFLDGFRGVEWLSESETHRFHGGGAAVVERRALIGRNKASTTSAACGYMVWLCWEILSARVRCAV